MFINQTSWGVFPADHSVRTRGAGGREERACLALEHTLCILPLCRLALTVGHSLKPHPPAELERAWDALEGQRDAIEFDRICTTN